MSLDVRAEESELGLEPTLLDTEPGSTKSAKEQSAAMAGLAEPDAAALERPRALPVDPSERYFAVDAMRGFALLGILAMNIVHFAWPQAAYGDPLRGAGFEGTDRVVWFFNHLFFEGKMMTIFSMLFGAGLVLMDGRAAKRGVSIRGVYYRRVLWLLFLGMIHAYLIWSGDILVLYAECGLFLYFFRNLTPRTLIITGVVSLFLFVPVLAGMVVWVNDLKAATARVEALEKANPKPAPAAKGDAPAPAVAAKDEKPTTVAKKGDAPVKLVAAGDEKADAKPAPAAKPDAPAEVASTSAANAGPQPTPSDKWKHDLWKKNLQEQFNPTPEQRVKSWNKELATYRGGYLGIVKHRAPEMFASHIFELIFGVAFFAGGRMLLGMGLMKLGVFSASRTRQFYLTMMLLGYGIGLPLMVFDALQMIEHRFSMEYAFFQGGFLYNGFGSIIVAMGHVGAMMLVIQSGALAWLTRRLAAVGRMALTNYLTHSIFFTTLFYGYGLGWFGTVNRTGLAAMVLAMWTFQLVMSPIWLRYFRYGPAEWLWRSLTYWRPQPMRI